jgi:membrane protein
MVSSAQDPTAAEPDDRGRRAASPTEIPPRGWKDVLARVRAEARGDNVSLLAGGVAFFGLLAIVPGLAALLSIYGLVADPQEIRRQVDDALGAAPAEVRDLVGQQLTSIESSTGGAVLTAVLGTALALWSASSAMAHLVEALNAAYDEDEDRGFVKKRGLALVLTVGAVVFMAFALTIIGVVPVVVDRIGLGTVGSVIVWILRWVVLLLSMMIALAVLYRWAPDRDAPRFRWVSPGAVFATVIWLIVSGLFSIYVSNFGSYNETYGTLGAVVVLMLWLHLTALVVILGAELNAELERQTRRDSTTGPPEALGRRGAYAADTVGESAEAVGRRDR